MRGSVRVSGTHCKVSFDLLRRLRCCTHLQLIWFYSKSIPLQPRLGSDPGNQQNCTWVKRKKVWCVQRKELKFSLHRNIIITLETTPPSIMVIGGVSFHWGGEWSCSEGCWGSQKCHYSCCWQSFIVQCPFSGRWIQAVHTKCQSNIQQPPVSLSRN